MTHPAERLFHRVPVVFTAHSAETAYLRERICAFALARDVVPVNPWMVGGYFLYGLVDRDLVRSEEHTSELQSLAYLVCRLLLEKKKKKKTVLLFSKKKNQITKLN